MSHAKGKNWRLLAVMYHYVRPLSQSRFPKIKALDLAHFRTQLDWLDSQFAWVTAEHVIAACAGEGCLPANPCLLTFDDGYRDHAEYVFPELERRGIKGAFFCTRSSLVDRAILDLNRIHYVLAGTSDPAAIAERLDGYLATEGGMAGDDVSALRMAYAKADHLDDADTVYVKHLLQYALCPELAKRALDALFAAFVSADSEGFAEELYLSVGDAQEMIAAGHHFGGHGDLHRWHTKINAVEAHREIERSREMLLGLGMTADRLSYCYPYGDHNAAIVAMAREAGFRLGFTTRDGIADRNRDGALELPRIDTIYLPPRGTHDEVTIVREPA